MSEKSHHKRQGRDSFEIATGRREYLIFESIKNI
jgi:hypothetical protein